MTNKGVLKRLWQVYNTTFNVLVLIVIWGLFLLSYRRSVWPTWQVIAYIVGALGAISDLVEAARGKSSLLRVGMQLTYCFLYLLGLFSFLYFIYGTSRNFNISLTHFDAFYFTLGTLTTGTGNINAISEMARYLQGTQMALDLILIGFAASLAISRFAATHG